MQTNKLICLQIKQRSLFVGWFICRVLSRSLNISATFQPKNGCVQRQHPVPIRFMKLTFFTLNSFTMYTIKHPSVRMPKPYWKLAAIHLQKQPIHVGTYATPPWILSGQIIIFHQPRFPSNNGISPTKPPFGVRSCEVAIIWPDSMCFFDVFVYGFRRVSNHRRTFHGRFSASVGVGHAVISAWFLAKTAEGLHLQTRFL